MYDRCGKLRVMRGWWAVLLTVGLVATPSQAQMAADSDKDAVLAPIYALFDGMREKDADKILAAFADGAMLWGTGFTEDGQPRLGSPTPMTDFAGRVTQAEAYIDEKIWDPVIEVHDNLASVVVKYALYVDGNFSHCGVDAFQLFRSGEGWKIFQVADTRRTEDCWEPPA